MPKGHREQKRRLSTGDRNAAAPIQILRVSTDTLPERDRFSAFQEEIAQKILKVDIIDRSAGSPRLEVAFMRLGAVAVGAGSGTPSEFVRYNHHLKDCSDGFRLDVVARAPLQLSHAGQERTYDVGWGHFLHHPRPYRHLVHLASAAEMLRCRLPPLNPL
jgi:hypothetical protein